MPCYNLHIFFKTQFSFHFVPKAQDAAGLKAANS